MNGLQLILKERQEQATKHGRTVSHDRNNNQHQELFNAALHILNVVDSPNDIIYEWPYEWNKSALEKIMKKDDIGKLTVCAALLMAENDRISRDKHSDMILDIAIRIDKLQLEAGH